MVGRRIYRGAVFQVGTRVQINESSSEWNNGDRHGEVVKITEGGARLHVKMDQSGVTLKRHASMWRSVDTRREA